MSPYIGRPITNVNKVIDIGTEEPYIDVCQERGTQEMTNQQQSALQSFKNELSQIHAAESRATAEEAAIERRLAASWFLSHPEDAA
jgi:hypothetical protein